MPTLMKVWAFLLRQARISKDSHCAERACWGKERARWMRLSGQQFNRQVLPACAGSKAANETHARPHDDGASLGVQVMVV